MKIWLPLIVLFLSVDTKAQKIKSIHINLYTDSLKKGTYNYINVDGLLENERYIPLDTVDLKFYASGGKFEGNNLWIPVDFNAPKVRIKITLRNNPSICKEFDIWIKQKPDGPLKSIDEILKKKK